jgi:hypothetical protein
MNMTEVRIMSLMKALFYIGLILAALSLAANLVAIIISAYRSWLPPAYRSYNIGFRAAFRQLFWSLHSLRSLGKKLVTFRRGAGQRAPEILSTPYSEIKEKISHTRLASKGLDDWAYRGAISGAIAGFLILPFLTVVHLGYPEPVFGFCLCFGLPAALFGGLIGVVVAIIGFYLSRPSFPARSSSLDCFEQENEATSQRPRPPSQVERRLFRTPPR